MKVLRLIVFTSVAFFALATMCVTWPSSASAQDSDLWENQIPQDSAVSSDADVAPDVKAPPITVTGQWQGTINDNLRGSGTISATFTQNKSKLTGSWAAFGDFGTVTGTVTRNSAKITFTFFPKKPFIHCRFFLKSTSASDTEIIGAYKFAACGPLTRKEFGTIDITPLPAP
jgi:hypothetical protein